MKAFVFETLDRLAVRYLLRRRLYALRCDKIDCTYDALVAARQGLGMGAFGTASISVGVALSSLVEASAIWEPRE